MARYTPGNVPTDAAALPEFLRAELAKIAQALETSNERYTFDTLYAAPKKFREGTVALADGVTWNPAAGAGLYVYRSGAWRLLG